MPEGVVVAKAFGDGKQPAGVGADVGAGGQGHIPSGTVTAGQDLRHSPSKGSSSDQISLATAGVPIVLFKNTVS